VAQETPASEALDRGVMRLAAVVVLGAIMSILDTTIVNVALDSLARDFNASLTTIQWVSTGYLLALASVIPLTGWGADRFGTKRLYMLAIALFVGGSVLAGLAWSPGSLIAFRVLQGLGGGMILPVGITILTRAAGQARIGRMMSVIGAPAMVAPLLGPVIGGAIVVSISWRWIFFVNVPIAALALVLAARILPRDHPQPSQRLDAVGLALLSPGLAAFVYGLSEISSTGGLSSRVLLGLGGSAILIAAFVRHALRAPNPLLDLSLFRRRAVAASAATTLASGAAFFGTMLLLPLYYQVVRGDSPLTAGLLLAPRGLGAAIAMIIAGRIVDRSGSRAVVVAGLPVLILSLLPWTQVTATTSDWTLGVAQFVQGVGLGMVMQPAMAAAYKVLEPAALARATSALSTIQRVGGSIGTALLAVVLEHQLLAAVPGAQGAGLAAVEQGGTGPHVASQVAAAFGATFWWGVGLAALALIPALLLPGRLPHRSAAAPRRPSNRPLIRRRWAFTRKSTKPRRRSHEIHTQTQHPHPADGARARADRRRRAQET
jgi:EmrB/QacA subfamily drug resistance transporter